MYFSKRNFGGGSLMVWAAFCESGCLELAFPSTHMNSKEHVELLQMNLQPFLRSRRRSRYTFQQDNAPMYVSRETRSWFDAKKANFLEWPACSPDMNPMENVWAALVWKIYAKNMKFNSTHELKLVIIKKWEELFLSYLQNLVNKMPNRIYELISVLGGYTHY